jgi:protein-arginine kinase activator protein McsA
MGLSLSSLFKSKEPHPERKEKEMIECPRCGRFFPKQGHEHEPLCRDCWKIEKSLAR